MSLALAPKFGRRVSRPKRHRPLAVDVTIVCSVAAGLAHVVATPSHYRWWPTSGLFFAVLGVAQLTFAATLWRGWISTRLTLVGVWATVAVIIVYVASRTVGIPGTPPVAYHGGKWVAGRSILPDGEKYVGPLDVFTLVAEVVVVVMLLGELPSKLKAGTASWLMWLGVAMLTAAVTGLV